MQRKINSHNKIRNEVVAKYNESEEDFYCKSKHVVKNDIVYFYYKSGRFNIVAYIVLVAVCAMVSSH
jgi:hypothetical protein